MPGAQAHYFAYGSNMSSTRLALRVPEARSLGAARISGYRLCCNKRGKDGSGKANLMLAQRADAWGVLFALPADRWATLDRYEVGYERVPCEVRLAGSPTPAERTATRAEMYLALEPEDDEIVPFDWYLAHMSAGAAEPVSSATVGMTSGKYQM